MLLRICDQTLARGMYQRLVFGEGSIEATLREWVEMGIGDVELLRTDKLRAWCLLYIFARDITRERTLL